MAYINCDFFSDALSLSTSMAVILPQASKNNMEPEIYKRFDKEPGVLYLLHGYTGDHTGWIRFSAIEQYAREMNLAIIMPAVGNSYYTNMVNDFNYWTFFSKELPEIVHKFFNVTKDPQRTFIAGLSMGGYGAMKFALTYPDKFAAAGTFSGALDIHTYYNKIKSTPAEKVRFDRIYGDMSIFNKSENDLFHLIDNNKSAGTKVPRLYQSCGTEDFLYEENINFKNHAQKNDLNLTYEEWKGEHNWEFWDASIVKFLKFIEKDLLK